MSSANLFIRVLIARRDGSELLLLIVGWEYGVNPTYGVYGPVMKAYHMCRRRRLVRSRELVDAKATKKQVETSSRAKK